MKYKFYAVVVIYNTEINKSVTCNKLLNIENHNINVIIVDNSTINTNNSKQSKENNWEYISMEGNAGLSKAYNRVLDKLTGEDGVIIWFDDDTNITQEYFDVLADSLESYQDVSIFCPVIYGQDGKIYSPNEFRLIKNKQLKDEKDKIKNNKFNAINSCTAVKLEVYKNYRYDEKLFLDQVDHNFFEDQRILKRNFIKLNTSIQHDFSLKTKKASAEEGWVRYEIMIPDFINFCNKGKARLVLGIVKIFGWGVREAIKYRRIDFVWWCIRCAVNNINNGYGKSNMK